MLRCLARATALVFPSVWPEPLSRVLLEALALGTPVAAMATGGTREILGTTARGSWWTTRPALADAVARLAGDDALRERTREAARARAEAFSPQALVPRYEAVVPEARLRVALLEPLRPPAARAGRDGARGVPAGASTSRPAASTPSSSPGPPRASGVVPGRGRHRALRLAAHRRHGRVLDRTLRYPRFARAGGRGGGAAGARAARSTSSTRRGWPRSATARLRAGDRALRAPLVMNPQGMEEHKARGAEAPRPHPAARASRGRRRGWPTAWWPPTRRRATTCRGSWACPRRRWSCCPTASTPTRSRALTPADPRASWRKRVPGAARGARRCSCPSAASRPTRDSTTSLGALAVLHDAAGAAPGVGVGGRGRRPGRAALRRADPAASRGARALRRARGRRACCTRSTRARTSSCTRRATRARAW